MRHWDQLHQEGSNWTGTYEVDDTDWRLCELIARIQYAMQQHFFGTLAEKDFDELLIEKSSRSIWVHFAVRPKDNRRKVKFLKK